MHVVAIEPSRVTSDATAAALANILGVAPYETRTRLRVLGDWPGVLVTYADEGHAQAVVAALARIGLRGWCTSGQTRELRDTGRSCEPTARTLIITGDGGRRHEVPLATVRLLLAGQRFGTHTESTLERTSSPRSLLGAAMGLPTAAALRAATFTTDTVERFVHVYADGHPVLVLTESSLRYAAQRDGVMDPTRRANFSRVVRHLKAACEQATWDQRLQRRLAQSRVLGPTLRPERHLDVAIDLLTRDLRVRQDPYR